MAGLSRQEEINTKKVLQKINKNAFLTYVETMGTLPPRQGAANRTRWIYQGREASQRHWGVCNTLIPRSRRQFTRWLTDGGRKGGNNCLKVVFPPSAYLRAKASGDTEEEIGYHHVVL